MTKLIAILITLVVLMVTTGPALHAQEEVPATPSESAEVRPIFLSFVKALKTGNVQVLKSFLSEEMYREYRVLLEENTEYPHFLKRYYEGAEIQLENIIREGNDLHGVIRVTFPGGDASVLKINAKKKDRNSQWKIGRVLNEEIERKSIPK